MVDKKLSELVTDHDPLAANDRIYVESGGVSGYDTYSNLLTQLNNEFDNDYPARAEWNQNGFPDETALTDSTLTWTDGGGTPRTLSIQPTGVNFDYWIAGIKYTTTGDTRQITDVEGIHVIYYDGATLTSVANPTLGQFSSLIRNNCLVSIVCWDTSASTAIYVGEERHGYSMSPLTHAYLHFVEGLRYISGFGLNTINADGAGITADAQFGVDAGTVADEDLYLTQSAVVSTTGLPIYYMLGAGAEWQKYIEAGFSCRTFDGTNATRLAFNEFTGGAWQLTEEANGNFVLYHVFATTEKDNPIISIMGQNGYATKGAARDGALVEIKELVLNDILFPEIRPIATIIFQTRLAYASAVNARVVSTDEGDDYIDWRNEVVSRTEISTNQHGVLNGLGSDDHTQYILVDGTRAFTGDVSLNSNGITLNDETIQGSTGGLKLQFSEATTGAMAGAVVSIEINVPVGSKVFGCQLRVDTTITGATSWTAQYSGGLNQAIELAGALPQNSKYNQFYDVNAASDIAGGEVDIDITAVGPNFTGGVIRAIVYYWTLETMDDV